MTSAISRLNRRIAELQKFDPHSTPRGDPSIKALEISISEALSETFGHGTPAHALYKAAAVLDTGPHFYGRGAPRTDVVAGLVKGKERAIALLQQAVRSLEERLQENQIPVFSAPAIETTRADHAASIFLVHGRDEAAKHEVARFVEKAGHRLVILHEQPHGGRTIIEKFEEHGGAAGFAIVLLTPDDIGGLAAEELKPRARQNVIGEMFWFAGRLGRRSVCALRKGDVELPSDFAGVGYTDMDSAGAWKQQLLKELEAAGFEVDWRKALG